LPEININESPLSLHKIFKSNSQLLLHSVTPPVNNYWRNFYKMIADAIRHSALFEK
jgi:hypothetical protein